jgi:hypothetical protein
MDRVFAHVDRTLSRPGRLYLYSLLRRPALSAETLADRDRVTEGVSGDENLRALLRGALADLGHAAGNESALPDLLWADEAPAERTDAWLAVFGLAGAASLLAAAFAGGAWVLAALAVFGVNAHLNVRTRVRHQDTALALAELGALLRCARVLSGADHPALADRVQRLRRAQDRTRDVQRSLAFVSAGRVQDLLYEYLSVFLLLEARAVRRAERLCRRHAAELRQVYALVGEIDALQSAASFRRGLATWTKPALSAAEGPARLDVEEAVHPLLEGARPNSMSLAARGCIVTGPNMAGKSTLLRTLGVNAILAQTLFTCTARRYDASFLVVRSSMCVADSLAAGRSLYLAEAERMLVLIRTAGGSRRALCLVDELFAGTNATDRAAASAAILGYLASRHALVVASTHDADLAESLRNEMDLQHFEAGDDAFRLQPGVTRERNALQILAALGFPEEVVARLTHGAIPSVDGEDRRRE